ncbi:ArsR/SmtB family transcription factor [Halomarina oriensis]|uniref:ArsR family transcriptional regulator n=1 Tax=Halomarina oriensis TaxID=671145 RepID=A0A6B0GK61_9EURY|nr:helix-turn-helix transcriptional regulator [Halomarina oriensis]MWG35316.1 ArsR family transcriptional regulator [Halomarina oriensis]
MQQDAPGDAAVFDVLGEETRLAILSALVERRRESPSDPALSFSALRERSGVRDSGRFNYHLGRLVDRFVEKSESGYQLNYAGREVAGALLSGAYSVSESKGPTELDDDCPFCDASVLAGYEDGVVHVRCGNDHTLYRMGFPPGAAADRSIARVLALSSRLTYRDLELTIEGVCPECYGAVDRSLCETEVGGEQRLGFETQCERCGMRSTSSAGACLFASPAFVAFCADHGLDPREHHPWTFDVVDDEALTVVEDDPLCVRASVTLDGETFVATLDEHGRTVSTERSTAAE